MLISCPNCTTRFSVSDAALGRSGRNLKCARCGHKWFQTPEGGPVAAPSAQAVEEPPVPAVAKAAESPDAGLPPLDDVPEPAGLPDDDDDEAEAAGITEAPQPHLGRLDPIPPTLTASPFRPRTAAPSVRGGRSWLVAGGLLIAGLLAAAYAFQDHIVAIVPQAAGAYRMLGLREEPLGAGLAFRNHSSERMVNGTEETLVVRGVIANTTDATLEVPALRLTLVDGERILQEKVAAPPAAALDPGGTVGFRITMDRPDPSARRFEVSFAPPPAAQP